MEITEREKTIIFNALGYLHDRAVDGFYNYHSTKEINELHEQFYKEIRVKEGSLLNSNEQQKEIKALQKRVDRYEDLALEHHYQTILDEME